MKITKLGHCCLVIEVNNIKILTDPGEWSTAQFEVHDIDLILITHEHPDHLHMDSVKTVLKNNPNASIITNDGVGALLTKEKIPFTAVKHDENATFKNTLIEGFGKKHADIYPSITPVENTGYFIDKFLFYPGDAFTNPKREIKLLALPVAGPWMKISEAIDYAKELKPVHCFPVHDGGLKYVGPVYFLPQKELAAEGIEFFVPEEKKEYSF
jgi:L-ascorbate metabolism protein UlaG (beta-lactamase superfamily)